MRSRSISISKRPASRYSGREARQPVEQFIDVAREASVNGARDIVRNG